MLDHTIVGWRAWYTEGREFNSDEHRWEDLPAEGVLVFCLYYRQIPKRRFMLGVTLYWHDSEKGIYACDNVPDARLPEGFPAEMVKEGRWTTDNEFESARQAAVEATEAPLEAEARRV